LKVKKWSKMWKRKTEKILHKIGHFKGRALMGGRRINQEDKSG
jgi:hypothetical protein